MTFNRKIQKLLVLVSTLTILLALMGGIHPVSATPEPPPADDLDDIDQERDAEKERIRLAIRDAERERVRSENPLELDADLGGEADSLIIPKAPFSDCSAVEVSQAECEALVDLYNNTNGGSWDNNSEWLSSNKVCNWYGISCTPSNEVSHIELSQNNLDGTLSTDFSVFGSLQIIDLGRNPNLTGNMTDVIDNMPASLLDLILVGDGFTGTIPPSVSAFTDLWILDLGDNQLTGDLPTIIPNLPLSIRSLYLDYNDFSGTLTNDFAPYTYLENLDLTRNSLDGDMGTILSGLATDIEVVFLGRNSFTGSLSTDFSGFTHLRDLNLERNNIGGNLETILNNMPPTMEYIAMNNNTFTGTVPAGASVFTGLTHLDLSVNSLFGQIETAIGNLPPGNLAFLDLGSNEFHGKIPSGISNINQLMDFSISYSPLLEGTIPLSITSLPLNRFDFRETYLCEPTSSTYAAWKLSVSEYLPGYLPTGICSILGPFNGSAEIISDQRVVAIGRPHIGTEIMAYNGVRRGAPTLYLPMLFNGKWNYTSTFTVQNADVDMATYDIVFKDAEDGSESCKIIGESLPLHGVKTYDVTNLGACDGGGNLPGDWFGGATISSDLDVTAVTRVNVNGTDAVTYNGFTGGDVTTYLPMLFRGKYGYQSAFYVQNLDSTDDAILSIQFYDADGNFTCTYEDLSPIGPSVTRGYWMGAITSADCEIGDPGFNPAGWAGSAVVNITGGGSNEIVAIGRPHLGTEVAAYNGFIAGDITNYLPMLFRGQWGYDSAFYIQNISVSEANISVDFYDVDGNFTCTYSDPVPLPSNATRGYWTPALNCNSGGNFPGSGWAGSAEISSSENVIAVGRPHLSNGQVVVYNAFTRGGREGFVPMTFRKFGGNETALYIQNLDGSENANVTITFYDEDDGFYCQMQQVVTPGSAGAIWLAALNPVTCDPIP